MATVTLKTIEQSDNVGMFSICFEGDAESEFEKFLLKFKDNATYNKDFNIILMALAKIIDKGALERFFRIEGKMSDNVKALALLIQGNCVYIASAYQTKSSFWEMAGLNLHAPIKRIMSLVVMSWICKHSTKPCLKPKRMER